MLQPVHSPTGSPFLDSLFSRYSRLTYRKISMFLFPFDIKIVCWKEVANEKSVPYVLT
eukprot:m.35016 g.35016  ORF g.35016 m.35016 type:complete len:58 (+) comp32047_c0_seq1:266-439(+)